MIANPPSPTYRSQLNAGMHASLAAAPGLIAWGLIAGVAAVAAGLSPLTAMAMCVIVYAGSAQLAALQMLATGTPIPVVFLAALVINSRFVLFSLSMSHQLPGLSLRKRVAFSYLLSDNGYASTIARFSYHPEEPFKDAYLLGTCIVVWVSWQLGTSLGVIAGSALPASWSLEFTVPLTFLALGLAVIRDRAMVLAAIVAGVIALLAWHLPHRLGLLTASAAGIGAGVVADRYWRKPAPKTT